MDPEHWWSFKQQGGMHQNRSHHPGRIHHRTILHPRLPRIQQQSGIWSYRSWDSNDYYPQSYRARSSLWLLAGSQPNQWRIHHKRFSDGRIPTTCSQIEVQNSPMWFQVGPRSETTTLTHLPTRGWPRSFSSNAKSSSNISLIRVSSN